MFYKFYLEAGKIWNLSESLQSWEFEIFLVVLLPKSVYYTGQLKSRPLKPRTYAGI